MFEHPKGCSVDLNWGDRERLVDAKKALVLLFQISVPKSNVQSGKKKDELDGPWSISLLSEGTQTAFQGLGVLVSR